MMKLFPSVALLFCFAAPAPAEIEDGRAEPPRRSAPSEPGATDFLRVDEDDRAARLQTAVTRYEKAGVTVDLLGAIHIADKDYYDQLNKRFETYDVLLFEMVGGEALEDGKEPEPAEDAERDLVMSMLGSVYESVAKFLELTGQKEGIDYGAKNFVHADLTLAEFMELQEEKGESLLTFALAAGQQMEKSKDVRQPNMARLLTAFLAGNPNALKMEFIHTLGQGDDQIAALAGENIIIHDRNIKCLEVLDEQIAGGVRKIGIFYGAAHYPDMEERLLEKGFRKTDHEWVTAWDVPKPPKRAKAKSAPRKDPS